MQQRVSRHVIQILSRFSNWPASGVAKSFKDEGIYAGATGWARFADLFLRSAGVGFALAGIIMFFAYNWEDLHKFLRLGIIFSLILLTVGAVVFTRLSLLIKQLLLLASSILVGVLFAVFGQIYQTGADAYDFFLGWTVFITIWALIADAPPLWILFQLLINITLIQYHNQVAPNRPDAVLGIILIVLNGGIACLMAFMKKHLAVPEWYTKTIGLTAVCVITWSIIMWTFEHYTQQFLIGLFISFALYAVAVYDSLRKHSLFYLCIISLSSVVILATLIIDLGQLDSAASFFFISLFIVGSITLLVRALLKLNRKWHEQQ